jgi:oligopeptide/dipeptide ABC transporter ATP-binding protein
MTGPAADGQLLEVSGLVTRYPIARGIVSTLLRRERQSVHAVEGVSFRVAAGEMVALVGESGCGKTTTAQTITRMMDPEAGEIRFRGRDITRLGQRELRPLRRQIQMIYQDPYESLDPRFRVREAIAEPLIIHKAAGSKADRSQWVSRMLTLVGLDPPELYADRFPHELSGGQRQRVAIAATMVLEPLLLIADEPVSMLDVSVRAGILSVLDTLRRSGLGILMITHDLSTAAHFADRICVMYLGRIVEEGPAAAVIHHPVHPYTKALLNAVPRPDPLLRRTPQTLPGEPPNPVHPPAGCRFHPRCPIAIGECQTIDPPLAATAGDGHRAACVRVDA